MVFVHGTQHELIQLLQYLSAKHDAVHTEKRGEREYVREVGKKWSSVWEVCLLVEEMAEAIRNFAKI